MSATISTLYGIAVYDSSVYDAPEGQVIASGETSFACSVSLVKTFQVSAEASTNAVFSGSLNLESTLALSAESSSVLSGFFIFNASINYSGTSSTSPFITNITKTFAANLVGESAFVSTSLITRFIELLNIQAFIASSFETTIENVLASISRLKEGSGDFTSDSEITQNGSLVFDISSDFWYSETEFDCSPFLTDVDIGVMIEANACILDEEVFVLLEADVYITDPPKEPGAGTTGGVGDVTGPQTFVIIVSASAVIQKIWSIGDQDNNIIFDGVIQEIAIREIPSDGVIHVTFENDISFDGIIQETYINDIQSDGQISIPYIVINQEIIATSIIEYNEEIIIIADAEIYDGSFIPPALLVYAIAHIAPPVYEIIASAEITTFDLIFSNLYSSLNMIVADGKIIFNDNFREITTDGIISSIFIPASEPQIVVQFLDILTTAFIKEKQLELEGISANISYYPASYYGGQTFILPVEINESSTYIRFIRASAFIYQDIFEIIADAFISPEPAGEILEIESDASILSEIFISIPININIEGYKGEPKNITADGFIGYRIFPVPAKERIV